MSRGQWNQWSVYTFVLQSAPRAVAQARTEARMHLVSGYHTYNCTIDEFLSQGSEWSRCTKHKRAYSCELQYYHEILYD